jgi:glycerol-3-phosphate O-acyltransferase
MKAKDKEKIAVEVTSRVLESSIGRASKSREAYLDNLINEVFYYEDKRVNSYRTAVNRDSDRKWLEHNQRVYKGASEQKKKLIVENIIDRHVREVTGHFSEPTYQFATSIAPIGMGFILNAMSPLKIMRRFPELPDVANNIQIGGKSEQIRKLDRLGTIILVPTHVSNLDSLVVGYTLHNMGLPPYSYGAGINLFEHKLLGFFMHRLGAYKVDRLKRHSLYKEVLKEYATYSLEIGYDNLFFPGGTRSRSGAIEQKLKLGLLGCGIKAYYNNIKNGVELPNIYIVPCTLNYQLTLEGETLIRDHLKEAGKSQYIIVDDEFSMPTKILSFMSHLVSLEANIYVNFGQALDVFGNPVDDDGNSLDGRGRIIDTTRYLYKKGRLAPDDGRDQVFTRNLADNIVEQYKKYSVISSTHILAWTAFELARKQNPDPDFYRFLRDASVDTSFPMVEIYKELDKTLDVVKKMEAQGRLILSSTPHDGDASEVLDKALKLFSSYHTKPALERRGDRLFPEDMNLLYFYRNRLWGYGLDSQN